MDHNSVSRSPPRTIFQIQKCLPGNVAEMNAEMIVEMIVEMIIEMIVEMNAEMIAENDTSKSEYHR